MGFVAHATVPTIDAAVMTSIGTTSGSNTLVVDSTSATSSPATRITPLTCRTALDVVAVAAPDERVTVEVPRLEQTYVARVQMQLDPVGMLVDRLGYRLQLPPRPAGQRCTRQGRCDGEPHEMTCGSRRAHAVVAIVDPPCTRSNGAGPPSRGVRR